MADVHPLVLVLDDAHWRDQDSTDLLRALFAAPSPPSLLFIASSLTNENAQNWESNWGTEDGAVASTIELSPFGPAESKALAQALLPNQRELERRTEAIWQESEGNPLFIGELVRASQDNDAWEGISLERAIAARILRLTQDARVLLATLSTSERGLTESLAAQACQSNARKITGDLHALRDERLIVIHSRGTDSLFSVAHGVTRNVALRSVSEDERRAIHLRLAQLFESQGADPETLALHYAEGGDRSNAFRFTERAGDAAVARSALARALKHYEQALQWAPVDGELPVKEKLADALGRAGLGPASAKLHLELAEKAGEREGHLMRAGEQYLLAGLTQEALKTLAPILQTHRLHPPRQKLWTAIQLQYRRFVVEARLRRLRQQGRSPANDEDQLAALGLSWALANGFAGIDIFLSVYYNSLTLWRAIEAREPTAIARALALDAILQALEGPAGQPRAAKLIQEAATFAHETENPQALGWVTGARAILALTQHKLLECEELGREALALLRDSDSISFREIGTLSAWFWLYPSFLLGQLKQVAKHAPELAREAEARGDRYTLSTMQTYILPLHFLAQGQPEAARREANRGLEAWTDDRWQNQHWAHLHSHCFIHLYLGQGEKILPLLDAALPRMKEAFQLRIQAIRTDYRYLEGRAHLSLLHQSGRNQDRSRKLGALIRALRAQNAGLAPVYADTLETGLQAFLHPERHQALFLSLAESYDKRSMILHSATARVRAAEALERSQRKEARTRLMELGVRAPEQMTDCLIPG